MSYARLVRSVVAAAAAVIALSQAAYSQHDAYQTIENWFKLPEGRKIGSTAGITVDRDGTSVWTFDRCGGQYCAGSNLAPIMKFDESGKPVKSFGAGMFVRPHGIRIDREGNVWVTDGEGPDGKDSSKNGKGHQVFKFSPEGRVLMTLGKAGVAGDGPDTFNQPSAVLIAPNGDIFVADGHGGNSNARIVKFSKDGTWLWIRAAGCLLVTAATIGSRSLIRMENSSKSGNSSAGRAACLSTRMTHSTSPTINPTRRRTRDSIRASQSAARRTARSGLPFPIPTLMDRKKGSRPMPKETFMDR